MSGIAIVVSFKRVNDDGGHGVDITVDADAEHYTVPYFAGAAGIDAPPLPGDTVATSDAEAHGSGGESAVGYADTRNAGEAAGGEIRIYARDANGAPMCTLFLRGDRSVRLFNENGSFELGANGIVTINGLTIDVDGNLKSPGTIEADDEITAMAASPGTSVTLSQHIHPHPMGPTSAATPGT